MTMDMWSDTNLSPFMAATAHWIEATPIQTSAGRQYKLNLRTDLIAFLSVPGRHTGEHLAGAFWHVLERIGIARKVSIASCLLSKL